MGLDRRSFLMFVLGGAAGGLFTPMMWKPLDDVSIWSQNWPWIPRLQYGEKGEKPAVVKLGGAEYGIKIQTIAGRPVTAKGDVEHPLSLGGIDPLGAAAVQLLYSPSRVKGPMKKTANGFEAISWDDAGKMLTEALAGASGAVACVSGDDNGSTTEVLGALLKGLGSSDMYPVPSDATTQAAVWQSMGGSGRVGYDLANADLVLALGADILGSWGPYVRNAKVFGLKTGKFVYAGPSANASAVVADKWLPVEPGKIGHLALAVAHHLVAAGTVPAGVANFPAFAAFVQAEYSPDKAEQKTGLPADVIRDLAASLASASQPVVVTGSLSGSGASGFDLMAGMSLNLLLGRVNKPGGVTAVSDLPATLANAPSCAENRSKDLIGYLGKLEAGAAPLPKVLLVYEANPAFSLPQIGKSAAVLEKIPFKVSFSQFMDETANMADLIMPNPLFLERLDDSYTPFGASKLIYSVTTPVLKPVVDAKPTADVILTLAAGLGLNLGLAAYEEIINAKALALGAAEADLKQGKAFTSDAQVQQGSLAIWNDAMAAAGAAPGADAGSFPLALATVAPMQAGSRQVATPPGNLLAIPENMLKNADMFVSMNGATAKSLGLGNGDKVKLTSQSGEVLALVNVSEGVMNGVVSAPLGFGHTAWDDYSRGKGDNVYKLLTAREEAGTGVYQWSDTRVNVAKI